jgi:hypothetical protein
MKVQQYSEKSVVLISENEKEIEYIKLQKQVLQNNHYTLLMPMN